MIAFSVRYVRWGKSKSVERDSFNRVRNVIPSEVEESR
jgi:hypothetical protein